MNPEQRHPSEGDADTTAIVSGTPLDGAPEVAQAATDGAQPDDAQPSDAPPSDAQPGDAQPGEVPSADEAHVEEAAASEPAFRLELPAFQGPLDLLLQLIERNELDITEVSLVAVTDQYLAQLRAAGQMDLGLLAEFISVGARLLLLKSRALLPRDEVEVDDEDEGGDDVSALIAALREYRRFKHAAEFLRERDGGHATYRREVPPPEVPLPTGLDAVTLNSLVDVIRDVLARMPEEEAAPEIQREPVRLRDRMSSLVETLERDGRTSFRRLIEQATSRTMIVVDFMAVLELIKQRYLEARQSESFGDIDLVRREAATTPVLAEGDGETEPHEVEPHEMGAPAEGEPGIASEMGEDASEA